MNKYFFLTYGIGGLSGNPRYVSYKSDFLIEHGWDVGVLYCNAREPIQLENLLPFKDNCIPDLDYYPSWYNVFRRKHLLKQMKNLVGSCDRLVIESNTLTMAVWGEMLAKELGAKHIFYLTGEGISLQNKSMFAFVYAKLRRDEFFTINPSSVKTVFRKFLNIEDPDRYHWNAFMGVQVKNLPFPTFDNLPKRDYTITHFGRYKEYIPYMLSQLKLFIALHVNNTFNIFFLGNLDGHENSIKESLDASNVNLVFHEPLAVIPQSIFTKSDIVIATAGCANIARGNNGTVISMDINNNVPLGILGYTTLDSNVDSCRYKERKSLCEWLEDVLIARKHFERLEDNSPSNYKGFDYQLKYVKTSDLVFSNCMDVRDPIITHDFCGRILMKAGLYNIIQKLYIRKYEA